MATASKDEGAILKVLEKNANGIRSTDLFVAVRKSVRSLTTFQKRLKHLQEMGRIRIEHDLNDMRVKIIAPTPKSREASRVLEAIDLLERLYLGKPSGKTVKVTEFRETGASEKEMQRTIAVSLLEIAHRTLYESWRDVQNCYGGELREAGGPGGVFIRVYEGAEKGHEPGLRFDILSHSLLMELLDARWRILPDIEQAIWRNPELKRLMESEGFIVNEYETPHKRGEEPLRSPKEEPPSSL
jgi:DNA-binding MarR family transcriptional regulator